MENRRGSGALWGPLFGARARDWADMWEGPQGCGTGVYEHVLSAANVRPGMTVLDCGCGAGRFVHLAAERGAGVAGIDAAAKLVEIAPAAHHKPTSMGDFEALPWPDGSFDVRPRETRRVSRGPVWVVILTRLAESGIPQVFASTGPIRRHRPSPPTSAYAAPADRRGVRMRRAGRSRATSSIRHDSAWPASKP